MHLLDYREIPAHFEKAFDAFISIEMLEVGSLRLTLSQVTNGLSLARWVTILQPVFQTSGLGSEAKKCHGCRQLLDLP